MHSDITRNYSSIIKDLLNYLPSRGLIILNFIVLIPLFTQILDKKQMSIYLIAIQILNLILTCSFDWISKSVLRFYEKYKIHDKLDEFLSSVFWLFIIVYLIIIVSYFIFKDILLQKFSISNTVFLYVILLLVPCGVRQFLYQILRLKNHYKLYTFSIAMYQVSFILLFFGLFNIFPNANAILIAMNIAITLIDFILYRIISIDLKLKYYIDFSILGEILKYALPLVVTNACYWGIFHISKLIFQNMGQFDNTAIFGVGLTASEYFVTPLLTLFIFVTFPFIIKRFETNDDLKPYFTNIVQLFYIILSPIIAIFCLFPKEITTLILPASYKDAYIVIPFTTMAVFIHEFLKFINLKYHMQNKTYIETIVGMIVIAGSFFINIGFIKYFSLFGAAIAMAVTEIILLFANIAVKFKSFDYFSYRDFAKTFIKNTLLILVCFVIASICFPFPNKIIYVLKIMLFLLIAYVLCYKLRKHILT